MVIPIMCDNGFYPSGGNGYVTCQNTGVFTSLTCYGNTFILWFKIPKIISISSERCGHYFGNGNMCPVGWKPWIGEEETPCENEMCVFDVNGYIKTRVIDI